jgi:hypothetical protein
MSSDTQGVAQYTWGQSSHQSFLSAKKHFNRFLQIETKMFPVAVGNLFGKITEPSGWTYANLVIPNITGSLMDHFGRYLLDARCLNQSTGGGGSSHLSLNCADRYMSSVKNGMLRDIAANSNHIVPEALTRDRMKKIRDGMVRAFIDRAIRENRATSKSHETATDEDLRNMAMLCIWQNDYQMAEMHHFVLTLKQLAGRGTECAQLNFSNVCVYHPSEFSSANDKIAKVTLWRSKTRTHQELSIFNHRQEFLMDWYFGFAYSMVMRIDHGISESLFPSFRDDKKKEGPFTAGDPGRNDDGYDERDESKNDEGDELLIGDIGQNHGGDDCSKSDTII